MRLGLWSVLRDDALCCAMNLDSLPDRSEICVSVRVCSHSDTAVRNGRAKTPAPSCLTDEVIFLLDHDLLLFLHALIFLSLRNSLSAVFSIHNTLHPHNILSSLLDFFFFFETELSPILPLSSRRGLIPTNCYCQQPVLIVDPNRNATPIKLCR